jgi:hypothetical protein
VEGCRVWQPTLNLRWSRKTGCRSASQQTHHIHYIHIHPQHQHATHHTSYTIVFYLRIPQAEVTWLTNSLMNDHVKNKWFTNHHMIYKQFYEQFTSQQTDYIQNTSTKQIWTLPFILHHCCCLRTWQSDVTSKTNSLTNNHMKNEQFTNNCKSADSCPYIYGVDIGGF